MSAKAFRRPDLITLSIRPALPSSLIIPTSYDFLLSPSATFRLKRGQHAKYLPYAFTEQGVSMLSAVLNSPVAVDISIRIMRAFVRLRSILAENEALRYAIEGLERRMSKNERDIQIAIKAIQSILTPPVPPTKKNQMGFCPPDKAS